MTKQHRLILVLGVLGLGLSCNGPRKAFHYYRLMDLVPYVAAITSVNETGDQGEVNYQDTVVAGSDAELWLAAKVEYYYKEIRDDYSPGQMGSKGSEEKITSFNLFLDGDDRRIPINDRIKKVQLNSVTTRKIPTGVPVPINHRAKCSFEGPEEFADQFNACADPFIYVHNLSRAYLFTLDTKGIPPGQYSLVVEMQFDSGRELQHKSGLVVE